MKNTLHNKIYPAAVIALLGAAISLLACTIVGARGVIRGFLPLWLFLFFGLLNIVLDKVPHTARWKWFKPAVFTAAVVVILFVFALFT